MGFKDWVADAPLAMISGDDGSFTLRKDRVEYLGKGKVKKEQAPLKGLEVHLESGEELQSRVTMTRLVALGIFAFAAKKKSGGEKYLTVEGPETYWTVEIPRKKVGDAMKFVQAVKTQVKAL